jgi:hypothetical protein
MYTQNPHAYPLGTQLAISFAIRLKLWSRPTPRLHPTDPKTHVFALTTHDPFPPSSP